MRGCITRYFPTQAAAELVGVGARMVAVAERRCRVGAPQAGGGGGDPLSIFLPPSIRF
jgi:hypothetical protein